MLTYDERLKSFEGSWAFSDESKCNSEALAAAGWFHYPKRFVKTHVSFLSSFFSGNTEAHCFSSLKVLDFEEDDDPMEEQVKRKKERISITFSLFL